MPDFHEVTMKALSGDINGFNLPGRQLRPGVWAGLNVRTDLDACQIVPPVYIGGSAEIQPGATLIGPVAIGAGAVVEAGAHVESSIVMDYTRVAGQTYCRNKILDGQFCIDADGTVLDGRNTDTAWLFGDARATHDGLNPAQSEVLANLEHFTGPQQTLELACLPAVSCVIRKKSALAGRRMALDHAVLPRVCGIDTAPAGTAV